MIDVRTMKPMEPVYTFVSDEGENINIASGRLREWANDKANDIATVTVDCETCVAEKFIAEGSVDFEHAGKVFARLLAREPLWPVLFGLSDHDGRIEADGVYGDVLTIDGHHTYLAHVMLGLTKCRAQFILRSQWEPFSVVGLPDITRQQLINEPHFQQIQRIPEGR